MSTVLLNEEKIHRGNLVLVNAEYAFVCGEDIPLIPADGNYPDILMRRDAANVLQLLMSKIPGSDVVVPVSGYRTVQEQADIWDFSIRENGTEYTKKFVARAGCSEHHTGLAIDLGLKSDNIDYICPEFPYDGVCEIFRRAASDYGFVQRYTKDKEAITGISVEPWHFRYVGFPHSKIMEESKLSLEEYMEFIKKYSEDSPLIYHKDDQTSARIYYVHAENHETKVTVPDSAVYLISGNNTDGFIITIFDETMI